MKQIEREGNASLSNGDGFRGLEASWSLLGASGAAQ